MCYPDTIHLLNAERLNVEWPNIEWPNTERPNTEWPNTEWLNVELDPMLNRDPTSNDRTSNDPTPKGTERQKTEHQIWMTQLGGQRLNFESELKTLKILLEFWTKFTKKKKVKCKTYVSFICIWTMFTINLWQIFYTLHLNNFLSYF